MRDGDIQLGHAASRRRGLIGSFGVIPQLKPPDQARDSVGGDEAQGRVAWMACSSSRRVPQNRQADTRAPAMCAPLGGRKSSRLSSGDASLLQRVHGSLIPPVHPPQSSGLAIVLARQSLPRAPPERRTRQLGREPATAATATV